MASGTPPGQVRGTNALTVVAEAAVVEASSVVSAGDVGSAVALAFVVNAREPPATARILSSSSLA